MSVFVLLLFTRLWGGGGGGGGGGVKLQAGADTPKDPDP